MGMDRDREREMRIELERLRVEHREVGHLLDNMAASGGTDPIHLQRLKKQKLALKDRIAALSDQLFPDIIA